MSNIPELWEDLFGIEISKVELEVLEGVARRVGDDDTTLILCAILMHFIVLILFRDPKSPFVIARKTAVDLDKKLKKLNDYLKMDRTHSYLLSIELKELRETVEMTEYALARAKKDAREREEFPARAYRKMAIVCFAASVAGGLASILLSKLLT